MPEENLRVPMIGFAIAREANGRLFLGLFSIPTDSISGHPKVDIPIVIAVIVIAVILIIIFGGIL